MPLELQSLSQQNSLKQRLKDVFTNDFHEKLSYVRHSNIDIQYILDPYGEAYYFSSYIKKMDNTITQTLKLTMGKSLKENSNTY